MIYKQVKHIKHKVKDSDVSNYSIINYLINYKAHYINSDYSYYMANNTIIGVNKKIQKLTKKQMYVTIVEMVKV